MFRLVSTLCLLSLLLCSVGCQMCGTPYDYCISANIARPDDFRGCGPTYRAGSIVGDNIHQVAYYSEGNLHNNAGNYGVTMPIIQARHSSGSSMLHREGIGIPPFYYEGDTWMPGTDTMPTIRDLIDQPPRISPMPPPILPPGMPEGIPMGIPERMPLPDRESLNDVLPFSPNDDLLGPGNKDVPPQPNVFPAIPDDLPITLEELQRLDPTVSDLQIISIEDSTDALLR